MTFTLIATSVLLIFMVLFLVGGIILQIFLSKSETKWLGLILPFVFFLFSIIGVLNIAVINDKNKWVSLGPIIATFLVGNIPTIILITIYLACREKIKKNDELKKMSIKDLE